MRIIPLPKKLLTIFTLSPLSPLSPKLTNSENSENGENVRFVLFFDIIKQISLFTAHFSLLTLMFGCSTKSVPVYALIKTPKIKIADQGFIKRDINTKTLIIYKAANKPVKITVENEWICINGKCLNKEIFIKKYISPEYKSDFFDKILNKECPRGFFCKSDKNKIILKDKKNGILIMIKELKTDFDY